jgi:hypothetical protein
LPEYIETPYGRNVAGMNPCCCVARIELQSIWP